MTIRGVFFDLDGTLVDTAPDMIAALNFWLSSRGKEQVSLEEAGRLCSGGSRALLGLRGIGNEKWEDAISDFLAFYEKTGYEQTVYFSDIEAMLSALVQRSYHIGIVTNKHRRYTIPIYHRLSMNEKGLSKIICGDDCRLAKPDPMSLISLAKQYNLSPQECIYVGDDIRDAQAAQAAGMLFVGVLWGYWRNEQWDDMNDGIAVSALISTPELLLSVLDVLDKE